MREVIIYGLHPTKIEVPSGKRLHHYGKIRLFFSWANQVYMAIFKSKLLVCQRVSNQTYEYYQEYLMAQSRLDPEDVFSDFVQEDWISPSSCGHVNTQR